MKATLEVTDQPAMKHRPGIPVYEDEAKVDWYKYERPKVLQDEHGRLLTILDKDRITAETKTIRVRISAEDGFDPQTEVDVYSLRFGAPEEVNFGRGGKMLKTERAGDDLIVTFDA
ncbi:MAG: hypothetical protein HQ581_29030, partial [Planctomycetes bacterium]|nr:hypothetical protein [Planctomycetota bacterium]